MTRYIDADVFIRLIKEKYRFNDFLSANSAQKIIDNIPTADVAPVIHAHWRWMLNHDVICTKCQYVLPSGSPVSDFCFCPYCGAKMDGDETS